MARPRKNSVKKYNKVEEDFVHDENGKSRNEVPQARPVQEIIGFNPAYTTGYKTHEAKDYLSYLNSLSKLDLQKESTRNQIFPNDSRETMIERLMKKFNNFVANIRTSSLERDASPIKLDDACRAILAKGK